MINTYNAKQLARIENTLVQFEAGKLTLFALIADLKFFTSSLQQPLGNLGAAFSHWIPVLDNLHQDLIIKEDGGYRDITDAENAKILEATTELGKALLVAKTD